MSPQMPREHWMHGADPYPQSYTAEHLGRLAQWTYPARNQIRKRQILDGEGQYLKKEPCSDKSSARKRSSSSPPTIRSLQARYRKPLEGAPDRRIDLDGWLMGQPLMKPGRDLAVQSRDQTLPFSLALNTLEVVPISLGRDLEAPLQDLRQIPAPFIRGFALLALPFSLLYKNLPQDEGVFHLNLRYIGDLKTFTSLT